ncbi:MAG: hypothetical protein LWX11_10895, partial [Firmicutes bacterium]|nr:hypothetical protein [Bacillota bacterium]
MSDFKAMLRSLSRSPFYVLGVTLFLALGLGVNLALGTLVQRQILRPHDAPEPQRMVTITVRRGMTGDGGSLSAENVLALKRQATTVTQIAALAYRNVVLDKGEQVSRVGVSRV